MNQTYYGKDLYLKQLTNSERLSQLALKYKDNKPLKPEKTPDNRWFELTQQQQLTAYLSSFAKRWASQVQRNTELKLSSSDYLMLGYPNLKINENEAIIISNLLQACQTSNINNPTLEKVLEYCCVQIRSNNPISLEVSQCIAKEPEVRQRKLAYFLELKKSANLEKFVEKLEAKKWEVLKKMIDSSGYPLEIKILLGDQDFYSLDGGFDYYTEKEKEILESEIEKLQSQTKIDIKNFFDDDDSKISVQRWSDRYSRDDFEKQLKSASEDQEWLTEDLLKTSMAPYYRSWGYNGLAKELSISDQDMKMFIRNDIIRTAAQYRLEANRIEGIQLWAETTGAPFWPIQISNYDQVGIPPSLVL
jgi:hypothetical protein